MKPIRAAVVLSPWCAVILLCAHAVAQEKLPRKIYWGVSTLSPTLWIPYIAKDAKLFEKNGIDVELVLLRGSGQTSQAMVAGSLFASSVALPAVMLADLNGADLVNVAHGIAVQGSKLMVRPEIRKVEDLKGKRSAYRAWVRPATCSLAMCCANTVSTQTAKFYGWPSATQVSGSRRC